MPTLNDIANNSIFIAAKRDNQTIKTHDITHNYSDFCYKIHIEKRIKITNDRNSVKQ